MADKAETWNRDRHQSAYAAAGVDIDAAAKATQLITDAVRTTYTPDVLSDLGAFGGLFRASALERITAPVLVASTDGVGTKTEVASALNRWDSIGIDLVNHCVNDILVQGARPLFFLDYVATAHLVPSTIATIVSGVAAACRQVGCALIGGETAEMPGVYRPGAVDLVGTVVGVVGRADIIDGSRIVPGDVVLGLPSSGLHTNGYTLARQVLAGVDWARPHPDLPDRMEVGQALLEPHRCYLADIERLREADISLHGLAHITGGGLLDNPVRILPAGCGLRLDMALWTVPPLFGLIQRLGGIPGSEMVRVFNMGLGLLVILPAAERDRALAALPDGACLVGEIVAGSRQVVIAQGPDRA